MFRKIPSTIASQHPDHASVPYWKDTAYISSADEAKELMIAFEELGVDEYKWDWEGKLVDESIVERLFAKHYDYFQKNPLGHEKFLTFRVPNIYEENDFRIGRAFMCILTASALAQRYQLHNPPMFEVIQPMTDTAKSMIDIQEAFAEISSLKHWMFNMQKIKLEHLEVIPLFEQTEIIANSDQILAQYISMHKVKFGFAPKYLRPYMARSDPSINSGHPATVFALKIALSRYAQLEKNTGIKMYPMIGCAALPFRGGLTPLNVADFVNEYAGIKTVLIQSAFRYDYSQEQAKQGIKDLHRLLPNSVSRNVSVEDEAKMTVAMSIFEKHYRETIEYIAPLVNQVATYFPSRRERVQHTGLFGYARTVGESSLPRAIKTTGSLYSIGLPPELFGTGRGIAELLVTGNIAILEQYYINIISDYKRVAGYVNKENLHKLITINPRFITILNDIQALEQYFDFAFEPVTDKQKLHYDMSSQILDLVLQNNGKEDKNNSEKISDLIVQSGIIRKSLG